MRPKPEWELLLKNLNTRIIAKQSQLIGDEVNKQLGIIKAEIDSLMISWG
jgi:hypothetical protein